MNINVVEELVEKTQSRIVHIVLDGVGDIYTRERPSPLEKALTPNLDILSKDSSLGLADPIFPGITPGSGPGHLALFGYNPLQFRIGRGILEALGSGLEIKKNALYARGNFCIMDENKIVRDRRAGRLSTEENKKICEKINSAIHDFKKAEVRLYPVKEHRFVVEFISEDLQEGLSDADTQKEGISYKYTKATKEGAMATAEIVNEFINFVLGTLKNEKVNGILLRGFAGSPDIPKMSERFKLTPAAIAYYPMYRGLAKLVGMQLLEVGEKIADIPVSLKENWEKGYDYFFLHVKKTDSFGEDGNYDGKTAIIEEFDKIIPAIMQLNPDVIMITADHSTPCALSAHSWHPVPLLIYSKNVRADDLTFNEKNCARGSILRINAIYEIPLLLAHSGKLSKFGA